MIVSTINSVRAAERCARGAAGPLSKGCSGLSVCHCTREVLTYIKGLPLTMLWKASCRL